MTMLFPSHEAVLPCRETNLKFKLGLRVTDEELQEVRQLAEFNGTTRDSAALFA